MTVTDEVAALPLNLHEYETAARALLAADGLALRRRRQRR